MAAPAIFVEGLHKRYGAVEAVRGIDLEVRAGEVFAFLGPNGAGKTTTVEVLEGYRSRDAGRVEVLGRDPAHADRAWRARLGIVLQSCEVEPLLTVRETVELFAGYYPSPRPVGETIELVGLTEQAAQRAGKLSGGQQRRLDVALALVGDPELVFLDEPTTGFDPSARRSAWSMIEGLRGLGKTVFLTTHYMDEAQRLADRVAIIARGQIVAAGPPGEISDGRGRDAIIRFTLPDGIEQPRLDDAQVSRDGRLLRVETRSPVAVMHAITSWALERGLELGDLELTRPSLEDVYLRLTGGEAQ